MSQFAAAGVQLPPGEFGIPPYDPAKPPPARIGKGRAVAGEGRAAEVSYLKVGRGRAVAAGGMVYVSSVGPVDLATGKVVGISIKDQAERCMQNLQAKLDESGTSMDKIVWANWSLRDPSEFDEFNTVWAKWFPGDAPIGQGTLMPALQRRAGFRISIGVIAEA
jgi:2-iminobutanoate/2-iminopropanoate deaminase